MACILYKERVDVPFLYIEGKADMITTDELSVVIPADWVAGPPQGSWTYEDYAALPDDGQRYEVVNGVLIIAPARSPAHQDIAGMIYYYLLTHVKLTGRGRVFMGPLDVHLGPKNVVQPDVLVVLNEHIDRIAAKKIIGTPDHVVEVASPSTAAIDRIAKYDIYGRAGVPEYWIVKPKSHSVEVLVLEHGEYRSLGTFGGQEMLP